MKDIIIVLILSFGLGFSSLSFASDRISPPKELSTKEDRALPSGLASLQKPEQPTDYIPSAGTAHASGEKIEVDPNTGIASLQVPISVPPGRAGIQPQFALQYHSSSGNSFLGMGWFVELGHIKRSIKKGVPRYNNTDTFALVQQGSYQELIDVSGNGTEFRPVIESAFLKIERLSGDYWRLVDRKGIRYYFGSTPDTRIADPQEATRIFQWNLDRVEDRMGNDMTVSYLKDGNQLYPDEIRYTGHPGSNLAPFAKVKFQYGPHPGPVTSYMASFPVLTAKRLIAIDVMADDNLVRRYVIAEDQGGETGQLRVGQIMVVDANNTLALPPTIFDYTDGQTFYEPDNNFSHYPPLWLVQDRLAHFLDMNKDGRLDIVRTYQGDWPPNGTPWEIYFNNGEGDFGPPVPVANSPTHGTDNIDVQFHDFNGDGIMDVIYGQCIPYQIWISTGTGDFLGPFAMDQQPTQYISITHNNLIQFIDMNRDGKADMVETFPGDNNPWKIYFNAGVFENGAAQFSSGAWAQNSPVRGCDNVDIRFYDFNGDGLLDAIYGQQDPYCIWVNNGVDGFFPATTVSPFPGISITHQNLIHFVDMNSDGLPDMVRTFPGNFQAWHIYYNNGKGDFLPAITAVNFPDRGMDNPHIRLIDVNGDGLEDVFWGEPGQTWKVWLNNGRDGFCPAIDIVHHAPESLNDPNTTLTDITGDNLPDIIRGIPGSWRVWRRRANEPSSRPDVLISINNSVGAQTSFQYANYFVEGLSGPRTHRAFGAFNFNLVATETIALGPTQSYTIEHQYEGGLWSHPAREFRGFYRSRVSDPDGHYIETYFYQDDIFKGRPQRRETYDAAGHLFGETENLWGVQELVPGVSFVHLDQIDVYTYDGNASGRRTQEKYFYEEIPQFGNVTRTVMLGEVNIETGTDIGEDSRSVEIEYFNNTSDGHWLLGLPNEIQARDHAGNVMRKTWLYYDGDETHTSLPTQGLLTKEESWAGDGPSDVNPIVRYAYDIYGNLISATDANGHMRLITYDPTYHLFPLEEENALGHVVQKEYYGVNGVPLASDGYHGLWGQTKCVTDPNGQQSRTSYDPFGRLTAVVSALDTIDAPTRSISYTISADHVKVFSSQREQHGQPGTIDSVEIYDGLGRLVQRRQESADPDTVIVSGQTEHDNRGLPITKYAPFFSIAGLNAIDPIDPTRPHTAMSYDAMGRLVETINPDGTFQTVTYDDWSTSTIDENGHQQVASMDAYGRLVRKEEYLGADGRSLDYPAMPFSVYAVTEYAYDSEGRLVKVTDAQGNLTTLAYDFLGRKIFMEDPDMGVWQYAYDANGNLTWQKDANGQEISFAYDALDRLVTKTDNADLNVNYFYDDPAQAAGLVKNGAGSDPGGFFQGRLRTAAYAAAQETSFQYDALGREIASQKTIDDTVFSVEREYDASDRLTRLVYPDGVQVFYAHNTAGQIQSIAVGPAVLVEHIDYDALGQVAQIVYANGLVTTYTYDPFTFRLSTLMTVNAAGEALQNIHYTYDSAGNIKTITDNVNTASQALTYDALNRLVKAIGSYGMKQYFYDAIGNILEKDGVVYAYGEKGAGPHAVTSLSGGTVFIYDANGNMTAKTGGSSTNWAYVYNTENRLVRVFHDGTLKARYDYDGDGGRTKATVLTGAPMMTGGETGQGIFDLAVYSRNAVAGLGPGSLPDSKVRRYVGSLYETGPGGGVDHVFLGSQRIATVHNGEVSYYLGDHLGSTNIVADASGGIKELCEYEPFGTFARREMYGNGSPTAWFYFTGKPLDDETGLYYYGARYYNPLIGRFLTPDTIVQAPNDPQTLNRYSYCNNNPVSLFDPTGHSWKKFWKRWGGFIDPLVKAIVTGDWKSYGNVMASTGITFFTSGFNPIVAVATYMTESVLDTEPGWRATQGIARQVFDDALGMRPKASETWSSVMLRIAVSLGFEKMLANVAGHPVDMSDAELTDVEMDDLRKNGYYAGDENVFGPSLKAIDSFNGDGSVIKGLRNGNKLVGSYQTMPLDIPALKQLGARHSSANALSISAAPQLKPWKYATWGTCHQATNLTLWQAGISSTVLNLGASWDMYVTTAVYGNYGGQLGYRIFSGLNANQNYEEK